MPEMATVCQESSGTPPNMFGPRSAQGVGPPHGYYNHYTTPSGHAQYGSDGYVTFQTSQAEHPSHLQHHMHGRQQQHHQQTWDYSMGVGVMGSGRHGVLPDEWAQCYLVPGSSTPVQNAYNYQYRGTPAHGALEYAPNLQTGHESDVHALEGSPTSTSSSPGEATSSAMGPNNQGAKSLRPPYEWMKPTSALPQAGKTRTKDKYRVVYSDHQRLELEKEFHFSKYITIRRKTEIASQLGLSERQVKIWFQNRRAKERKQNKKREEQVGMPQHGASGNSNADLQQHKHLQHSSNHESLSHPFIPKIELDDDKSNIHELTCHSTTHAQVPGLTSHSATPTSIILNSGLHHSPNMVMSPIIMGRSHAHQTVGCYHDNVQTSTISSSAGHDEATYRMTANSENTGINMNISGSSDNSVVSLH